MVFIPSAFSVVIYHLLAGYSEVVFLELKYMLYHNIPQHSATPPQSSWSDSLMPKDASALDGQEKSRKKTDTHLHPGLTSTGLVLLAKFGVCLCGLAQASIFSICSHLRSKGCACLWEALSFCLVMSALSRKTSPCFSSVQGHTHTQTPLERLLYKRFNTI